MNDEAKMTTDETVAEQISDAIRDADLGDFADFLSGLLGSGSAHNGGQGDDGKPVACKGCGQVHAFPTLQDVFAKLNDAAAKLQTVGVPGTVALHMDDFNALSSAVRIATKHVLAMAMEDEALTIEDMRATIGMVHAMIRADHKLQAVIRGGQPMVAIPF